MLYIVPKSNSMYVGKRKTVDRKFVSMHVGNSPKNKLKRWTEYEMSLEIYESTSLCILTSCIHTTMPVF